MINAQLAYKDPTSNSLMDSVIEMHRLQQKTRIHVFRNVILRPLIKWLLTFTGTRNWAPIWSPINLHTRPLLLPPHIPIGTPFFFFCPSVKCSQLACMCYYCTTNFGILHGPFSLEDKAHVPSWNHEPPTQWCNVKIRGGSSNAACPEILRKIKLNIQIKVFGGRYGHPLKE
jgi:hypothetical protein